MGGPETRSDLSWPLKGCPGRGIRPQGGATRGNPELFQGTAARVHGRPGFCVWGRLHFGNILGPFVVFRNGRRNPPVGLEPGDGPVARRERGNTMRSLALRVLSARMALILSLCATVASATTYTVTNTADSGAGSLRQAITDANIGGGTDTIAFNIPGSGVHTIEVPTQLPTITSPVIIDGSTQPGYAGAPLIELHGVGIPGFYISAGGSTLRGLVLNGFGILLTSAGGNLIEGCYIGTDATGTVATNPGSIGLRMISSPNNTIGGTSAEAGNLISGNGSVGVSVESSDGQIFQGNRIGTDITGTVAVPNGTAGLSLSGSSNITVGGSAAGAGNLISGNIGSGISISYGSGFVIQGNFIGTDITGTKALGNGMGINDSGGTNAQIGGSGPGEGNLVSGNNGLGIYLYNFVVGTTVLGNLFGTDVTGALPLGNVVGIATANIDTGIQIGGTGPGEGNVIAFNSGYLAWSLPVGVLTYPGSHRITIRGNSI